MFNERNTVQDLVVDTLKNLGWRLVKRTDLERQETNIIVEKILAKKLQELNPALVDDPTKVDEILYKLQEIILSANDFGLIKANEQFSEWLKNQKTMPYGENGQHIPVKLIDFDNPQNNDYVVATEYSVKSQTPRRADIILLINGIPLVNIETKTPIRPSESWADAALQIFDDYEKDIKELYVPMVYYGATEGKELKYGTVGQDPVSEWTEWKKDPKQKQLVSVADQVNKLFNKNTVLEMLQHYTVYATDDNGKKIKLIARYPQYEAVNLIVERVLENKIKKGLIWHFQGSGKSLLMILAALRLRIDERLKNPTVIIVVDRIDLDIQIAGKFNATNVPNTIQIESRDELKEKLTQDTRKVIITTIQKFAEADSVLNTRDNIIVLVDEADRTQEGELGRKMRNSLPNAFLFGLTGTPINEKDRNTFVTFGSDDDENRYLHRYSFEESVKDGTTLPIVFEPRLTNLRIDRKAIDEGLAKIGTGLSDADQEILTTRLGNIPTLLKDPDTIREKTKDMIKHFKEEVEPNGFKAMVVAYDRDCCELYKDEFDKLQPGIAEVVMTVNKDDSDKRRKRFTLDREQLAEIQKRFSNPNDPLKFLIVTQKLLRGFDAPILQVMYLDKILKNQGLLQTICRVNRPKKGKSEGIIVDYIGVFDDVSKSITYDFENIRTVVTNVEKYASELPKMIEKCLSYFEGVDRTKTGYQGLISAQEKLNSDALTDEFAKDFYALTKYWNLGKRFATEKMAADFKWLVNVYDSLQPPSARGTLVWKRFGPKVLDMIHQHVDVLGIKDDLDVIVLNDKLVESLISGRIHRDPREIEINIIRRLKKNQNDPRFIALGERLEKARDRYIKKIISSIEFLKELLIIAKDLVQTEQETKTKVVEDKKQALTKIFDDCQVKNPMVKQIVTEIDEIVIKVRFDGWASSNVGEREIKQAIYKILFKHKLHHETNLFDRIYDYIKTHY